MTRRRLLSVGTSATVILALTALALGQTGDALRAPSPRR